MTCPTASSLRALILSATVVTCALPACGSDANSPADSPDSGTAIPGVSEAKSSLARELAPDVPAGELSGLTDGQAAFALDLFPKLGDDGGNLFFSPLSIHQALTMTYAGAAGDTATEMASVLHLGALAHGPHAAQNALDLSLAAAADTPLAEGEAGAPLTLEIANSIWGAPQLRWEAPFLDTLALNYGAGLQLTDFAADPEAARQAINAWVADRTHDRIAELISQGILSADTAMVLVNAIFFKASWATKFEEAATRVEPFQLGGDATVDVPMMRATSELQYAAGEGYQAAVVPYVGGRASMLLVVPDGADGENDLTALEQRFDVAEYTALLGRFAQATVDLSLPKFEFSTARKLGETLQALGMHHAFNDADFSGMTLDDRLFISEVIHQAFVKVDESGTEAAAATAVVVDRETAVEPGNNQTVHADRPFLFFIRDEQTQAILFAGRVVNPAP